MWLKFEGFKDLLRDWWQSLQFFESCFVLASKLKAMKGILKVWNKEVFGRVETKWNEGIIHSRMLTWKEKVGQQRKKIL